MIDRSQNHRTKDRFRKAEATPTNQSRLPPVGFANDQTQVNRSIIPTGYKDAPQYRSIEPQTLELLCFSK
jgi:hypothetical protein